MYVRVKLYRGTKPEAWAEAHKVEDRTGGHVMVGEYLAGIGAWEILQGPPLVPDHSRDHEVDALDWALS